MGSVGTHPPPETSPMLPSMQTCDATSPIRIDCQTTRFNGATASSKGTRPVCRLPLSALLPSTRECHPWRPAAVLQYDTDTATDHQSHGDVQGTSCWPPICKVFFFCNLGRKQAGNLGIHNPVPIESTAMPNHQPCLHITRS